MERPGSRREKASIKLSPNHPIPVYLPPKIQDPSYMNNAQQALHAEYQNRATTFAAKATQLKQKYQRFALLRLLTFFAGIALLILLWQWQPLAGAAGTVLSLLLFHRFTQWHQRIREARYHQEALVQINQREMAALTHDYRAFADGQRYQDPTHPYSVDLDIFGPYSFYQYTNRTSTVIGADQLAADLLELSAPDNVLERQAAIRELGKLLDWRQHFLALGQRTEDSAEQIDLLLRWLRQEPFVSPKGWLRLILPIFPFLILPVFVWLLYQQQFGLALLCLVPAFLILRPFVERVNRVHEQTNQAEKALRHYAKLIQYIEQQDFSAPLLVELRAHLLPEVSRRIDRLSYIISQLNARYNAFAILLNLFGLWDLQWMLRLERWRAAEAESLAVWFDTLAHFEALSSLATTVYNHPDWVFPVFTEKKQLEAEALGHPLLPADQRISNQVTLPTEGHIKLLTGSNMAGKSTFLRTVGLNIVLANAGLAVCSSSMELPRLKVYTSMRTQDALHESTSSFYAELKRLKIIIEAVEQKENVFFLLDEILKGTNSRDRHTGSKALIHQLIQQGGGGIVATHDLELGSLEAQYGGAIENWCMEVSIEDGQLDFDYKIKRGVSQSFNATLLMQQMGIKIEER